MVAQTNFLENVLFIFEQELQHLSQACNLSSQCSSCYCFETSPGIVSVVYSFLKSSFKGYAYQDIKSDFPEPGHRTSHAHTAWQIVYVTVNYQISNVVNQFKL